MTRLHRLLAWLGVIDPETPSRDELAARVEQLEHQVEHLTGLIDDSSWPEPYRHRRAAAAVDRLTGGAR